jgi:ribosomal protein L32
MKPETLISKSNPKVRRYLRALIAEMVRENPTCGEMRVALELGLKLGIGVWPRTVRAYWTRDLKPRCCPSTQRWTTFAHNHAGVIVIC